MSLDNRCFSVPENIEYKDFLICKNNLEALESKAGKYGLYQILKEHFGDDESKAKKFYRNIQKLLTQEELSQEERDEIYYLINDEEFLELAEKYLEEHLRGTGPELEDENINIDSMQNILLTKLVKKDLEEILGGKKEGKEILEKILKENNIDEEIDNIEYEDFGNFLIISVNYGKYYLISTKTKVKEEYNDLKEVEIGDETFFIVSKNGKNKLIDVNEDGEVEEKIEAEEILDNATNFGYFLVKEENNKDYFLYDKEFKKIEDNLSIDEIYISDINIEQFYEQSQLYHTNIINGFFIIEGKVEGKKRKILIEKNGKIHLFDKIAKNGKTQFFDEIEKNQLVCYDGENKKSIIFNDYDSGKLELDGEVDSITNKFITTFVDGKYYLYKKDGTRILENYDIEYIIFDDKYFGVRNLDQEFIIFDLENQEEKIRLDNYGIFLDILRNRKTIEDFEKQRNKLSYKLWKGIKKFFIKS